MFFTPSQTQAGFFSAIFSTEKASATASDPMNENSQTMELLQSNNSSAVIPHSKDSEGEEIKEDVTINIISENALLASNTPLSSDSTTNLVDLSSDEISVYVVRKGDSLAQIAEMFDISVDTILSANDLPKGAKIKEGDVLLILPFSAVEHTVVKGETLRGIANKYKVSFEDILYANEIDEDTKITIGTKLIIPGGNILTPAKPKVSSSSLAKSGPLVNVSGYFINPVPGSRRTRGITSYHHGVDLAAPSGTPIMAAASGRVLIARNGYNGGFGNYVVIQHPNGTKTLYAHMSRLGTSAGAQVSQGQVIGYVGNTGRSRGDHLHIEVVGARNPY